MSSEPLGHQSNDEPLPEPMTSIEARLNDIHELLRRSQSPQPETRTVKEVIDQAIKDNRTECLLYSFTIPLFSTPFIACAALALWHFVGSFAVTIAVYVLITMAILPAVILAFLTLKENRNLRLLEAMLSNPTSGEGPADILGKFIRIGR